MADYKYCAECGDYVPASKLVHCSHCGAAYHESCYYKWKKCSACKEYLPR